jgi:FO synthase
MGCGKDCAIASSSRFIAFQVSEELRGPAYVLPLEEITKRVMDAWDRGATEVSAQVESLNVAVVFS